MTLSPQVQSLVDQLVQVMGLQALRPSGIEINMDGDGIVQDVKPRLIYRRRKDDAAISVDNREQCARN